MLPRTGAQAPLQAEQSVFVGVAGRAQPPFLQKLSLGDFGVHSGYGRWVSVPAADAESDVTVENGIPGLMEGHTGLEGRDGERAAPRVTKGTRRPGPKSA